MSYAQNGLIEASDFNNLVGSDPGTGANKLNTVWAIGGTTAGYGQTAVAQVAVGQTVAATKWNALVSNTASAAAHSGTSITSVTAPVAGDTITYASAIPSNLTSIYTSRRNAASVGSTSASTATRGSAWQNKLTFTHTATFSSGNAARYFFNAGGQIKMTASHPASAPIDDLYFQLAQDIGTVVMSSPNSGTISIAGTTYSGISKIGGGGNTPTTLNANKGYFGLTTTPVKVFEQTASTGPSSYLGSLISITVSSNGAQAGNGDTGSIITITTIFDEVPNGMSATAGSAVTLTLQKPETTNLTASWGTPTLASSVTGS